MSEQHPAWLVTGGAGYIGAHVVRSLLSAAMRVVVIDNLSTGLRARVPDSVPFAQLDCRDHRAVERLVLQHDVVGIMHLAAFKQARESLRDPMSYWVNNMESMLGILRGIEETQVRHFVFSSSCSIYGAAGLVNAGTQPMPQSPYARTKYVSEMMLQDLASQLRVSTITLRYFNVIGNDKFDLAHDTSTECLVPAAYSRIVRGQPVEVFGTNHRTPDGTALRDYVDVRDLSDAHLKSAQYLMSSDAEVHLAFDIGTGQPTSVQEILLALQSATGKSVTIADVGCHPADPAAVWSDASQAMEMLNWMPQHGVEDSVSAHVASHGRRDSQQHSVSP